MKKFILGILISVPLFALDTRSGIYSRIANEYDPTNAGIRIKGEKNGDILIKGARGESKIKFEGENVSKIIITHRFKNEIQDKALMENLLINTGYFIDEPEIVRSKLSNETQKDYEMTIEARISGKGVVTKAIDMALVSKTWGLLYGGNKEQLVTIKITRKK